MKVPAHGTPEWHWWRAGAEAEAQARVGMLTKEQREFLDAVEVLLNQGRTRDATLHWLALVFTADWSLRERLRLAWRVVRRT